MRAVVQRVRGCAVSVDGVVRGEISEGLLVYLGVGKGDTEKDAALIADKVTNLRIFEDAEGRMNRSVLDTGGGVLVVSQFTLYGDAREGRRPSYSSAADPDTARTLYETVVSKIAAAGLAVATGVFRAAMEVSYTNMGPITILLDSEKTF
jgi:D-aminoacyl-tRNA deacylase